MKRGNFRTKKDYQQKGKIKFVVQAKINGIWKSIGDGKNILAFDNEGDAIRLMMTILQFGKIKETKINFNGVDVGKLKVQA